MTINNESNQRGVFFTSTITVLSVIILLSCSQNALAQQWNTNVNDISNANSGNVGVGTAPAYKFDVLSAANIMARFRSSAAAHAQVLFDAPTGYNAYAAFQQNGVSKWFIGNIAVNNRFSFVESTGATEVFSILQNGKVGIGTTTPGAFLQVGPGAGYGTTQGLLVTPNLTGTTYDRAYQIAPTQTAAASSNSILMYVVPTIASGVTQSTMYGLYLDGKQGAGTITNYYPAVFMGGNVGIGTGTPSVQFHLQNASTAQARIESSGAAAAAMDFKNSSRRWVIGAGLAAGGGDFSIYDANAALTRMFVDSSGKFGIGNTAPTSKLDVTGTVNATGLTVNGTAVTSSQWTTSGSDINYATAGKVGIGISSPTTKLDVNGTVNATGLTVNGNAVTSSQWTTSGSNINYATAGKVGIGISSPTTKLDVNGTVNATGLTVNGNAVTSSQWTTNGSNINFASPGKVGIGTPNPIAALDVTGDIKVSGNINAKYQDLAEWVPATHPLPAGTVAVLNPNHSNQVMPSSQAYDTRVAGVISQQPGIVLGESGPDKVLVATTGRVRVKVDATHSPIRIGDLLVASDQEGMAMKSQPIIIGGVEIHRPGTLIGKALEPLAKGKGEILVLLSLQ